MATTRVPSVGIIGLGLIGGSFARALKVNNAVDLVLGFDLRATEMAAAARLGVVDVICENIATLVAQSNVIVLATPVKAIEPILREMAPHLTEQHIISDMGSVKGAVVETVKRVFGKMMPRFVPGHPIAGSEKSGVAAANPELFIDHKTILTPLSETSGDALDIVAKLWLAAGAKVLMMSPARHDEVLAATSHLPHLIAFSLVDTLAGSTDNKDIFRYAAGGFRDFTRIAASDPVMWHDIYLSNRQAVLKAVDEFSEDLGKLRHAIDVGDGEKLLGVFTRARAAREHFGNMLAGKRYSEGEVFPESAICANKCLPLRGSIRLSGDKSISHRVVVFGALAKGITRVEGFLESETSLATIQAFRDMGVVIEGPDRGQVVIHGVGLHGLQPPAGPLYVGHSDTSMRLLAGVMSGQSFSSEIIGDHGRHNSMLSVVEGLGALGAEIEVSDDGMPPLVVKGSRNLKGKRITLQKVNADVKTSLLLAAIYAEGKTTIIESCRTRDHSERLLAGFEYPVKMRQGRLTISGRDKLIAKSLDIPADFTLAFYFVVAASIVPDSDLILRHVGLNESRVFALSTLQGMGARIEFFNYRQAINERVADLRICTADIAGFELSSEELLQASEEFPALLVAAAFAKSSSRIKGYSHLPVEYQKQVAQLLVPIEAFGGTVELQQDDFIAHPLSLKEIPQQIPAPNHSGAALACIIMASCIAGATKISNCAGLLNAYPQVIGLANEIGFKLERLKSSVA